MYIYIMSLHSNQHMQLTATPIEPLDLFSLLYVGVSPRQLLMGALTVPYKENPVNLQQIIPLDYNSFQTLPDSHVWLDHYEEPSSGMNSAVPALIPVIDLTDPDAQRLISEACETWGMFQLIGHGIPAKLMEDMESETEKLFGLPIDQKLKALRSPGGSSGYGLPRISQFFEKFMWHEGFTIMGSSIDHARQLWPHGDEGFCETMDEYQNQMHALTEKLIRIIFKSLNINAEEVNWLSEGRQGTAMQLNSYPACPEPTRAMGLAPHTDTSLITIVKQYKISGLQIFKDGVGWIPVQPLPDALTVNLGDFFHILSNGLYASIRHRVVVNAKIQRYSVAHFYAPPADFVISRALGPGQVPKFRSITVKEYGCLKGKHLENALSLIQN